MRLSFSFYLILVLTMVLGLFAGAELLVRDYLVHHHNLAKQIDALLYSTEDDLIIGDSHTGGGFRAPVAGFANLSLGGMSVPMLKAIEESAASRKAPARVMLVASPQLFAPYRLNLGAGDYALLPVGKLTAWQQVRMAHPLMRQAVLDFVMSRIGLNSATENDSAAQTWQEMTDEQRREVTAKRMDMQMPADAFATHEHAKVYADMVKDLVAKGAQVCLIRPPVTDYYEDIYRQSGKREAVDGFFTHLAAETGAKYVSYLTLPHTFGAGEFENQDHLNVVGSAVYTPLILEACFGD